MRASGTKAPRGALMAKLRTEGEITVQSTMIPSRDCERFLEVAYEALWPIAKCRRPLKENTQSVGSEERKERIREA